MSTHLLSGFQDLGLQFNGLKLGSLTGSTPPVINLASGNNDLYTVPAGRRAIVLGGCAYNTSGGALTIYPTIKVGATTYRLSGNLSPAADAIVNPGWNFIFEAGDVIGANASGVGLNLTLPIFDIPASSPCKTVRILDTSAADLTLYTCPANKRAYNFSTTLVFANGVIQYCGNTATPNLTPFLVPSGGAKGTTNKVGNTSAVGANTRGSWVVPFSMAAGDTCIITADGAGAIAWLNLMEVPA